MARAKGAWSRLSRAKSTPADYNTYTLTTTRAGATYELRGVGILGEVSYAEVRGCAYGRYCTSVMDDAWMARCGWLARRRG